MATEYLTQKHVAGKTVYYRFLNPANNEVFDFDDNAWEANLAACTTPKLAASENTDFGDTSNSLYIAALDMALLNSTGTPMTVIIQSVDDLATDVIIAEQEIVIASGARVVASNLTQILGAALTETSAGYLTAAFKKLFNVATPVLTVEADVTGAHAATDALIEGIGTAGGAAISVDANDDNYDGGIAGVTSATPKVGTQTATYAATSVLDGTPHIMTHAGQSVDIVYQFLTGGGTSPVSVVWTGLINPNNDILTISMWDHVGGAWEVIGTAGGQSSTTAMVVKNLVRYARHMGTSATELGKVYLRLNSAAGYNHIVRTDQVYVEYAITSRTVGYADGAIWVDTVNGIAGTEDFVNGTADNPVRTWADALTLSASLKIKRFHIINGSTITLSGNSDHFTLIGSNWTLALNGQSCSDIYVFGAESVTGTCTGGTAPEFYQCVFGDATLPPSHLDRCGLTGTITAGSTGSFTLDSCYSLVSGVSAPIFDFGAAIANEDLHLRHYSGGIEIKNLGGTGTDSMSLEGHGQLILNASCSAGTIAMRGHFTITDNVAGGFVAGGGVISDDARFDTAQIAAQLNGPGEIG